MKEVLTILITFQLSTIVYSQYSLNDINADRLRTNKNLSVGLTSWASVNIIGSGIGWATSSNNELKYFHQMNVMWNTVNLGLAIPGIINSSRSSQELTYSETLKESSRLTTIYLINAGLDLGYIGTGIYLNEKAKTSASSKFILGGYGKSILVQGSFLLIFDLTAARLIHYRTTKKIKTKANLFSNGTGLGLKISF